jgi:hypothetical protein
MRRVRPKQTPRPSQSWRSNELRARAIFVPLTHPGPCERIEFGIGECKGCLSPGVIWECMRMRSPRRPVSARFIIRSTPIFCNLLGDCLVVVLFPDPRLADEHKIHRASWRRLSRNSTAWRVCSVNSNLTGVAVCFSPRFGCL